MRTIIGRAVLVALTAVVAPLTPAAAVPTDAGSDGCVSDAEYAQLAVGQRLAYIRAALDDGAQTRWRRWSSDAGEYQERLYRMCTPHDSGHGTLTTRFMHYQGVWRAYIVDTHVGPEE